MTNVKYNILTIFFPAKNQQQQQLSFIRSRKNTYYQMHYVIEIIACTS